MRILLIPFLLSAIPVTFAQGTSAAPVQDTSRDIWDTGFLKKRPQPPVADAKPHTSIHYKPALDSSRETSAFPEAAFGITLWRLRPPAAKDHDGSRLLIQDNGSDMVPERIDPAGPLHVDDRIRIAIEVPRHGFLYVLDRESYRDGSFGDPILIFPAQNINHGDNEVSPGRMIEIPPQSGSVHALRLTRSGDRHIGEDLILVFSPQPLTGITPAEREKRISATLLQQWEHDWSADGLSLGLVGVQAEPWSANEKKAGDADTGYVLTQSDPMPTTIVSVGPHGEKPTLIHFPIPIQ